MGRTFPTSVTAPVLLGTFIRSPGKVRPFPSRSTDFKHCSACAAAVHAGKRARRGSKPHYGSIVLIGDPNALTPLINASSLWGTSLIGDVIFVVDFLGNFFEHHLPGMQAYNLDVSPDPGVVPWLGATTGPVEAGYGDLTIPQIKQAASQAGTLITP